MSEEADALEKLATQGSASNPVSVVQIQHPSIQEGNLVLQVRQQARWQDPIKEYLRGGTLPEIKSEARNLKFRAARYVPEENTLYKRGFSYPLLRCLDEDEAEYALR